MTRRHGASALALGLLATALGVGAARASTFESGADYVLAAGDTVVGNLFVGGESVTIDGTVDGDLFTGGTTVTINGTVRGDVFAGASKFVLGPDGAVTGDLMAGGTQVDVGGEVGEDARVAGYVVRVLGTGRIADDLMAAGYAVEVMDQATVAGEAYAGAYQIELAGAVAKDARLAGESVALSGRVGGDAHVTFGDASATAPEGNPGLMFWRQSLAEQGVEIDWPAPQAPGLDVADSARVEGELALKGPREAAVPSKSARSSTFEEVVPEAPAEAPTPTWRTWLVAALKRYLAFLLVGAVAVALAPRLFAAAARQIEHEPLQSTGWGCLAQLVAMAGLIALGVALVLVAIVLGAAQLGGTLGPLVASIAILTAVLLTFGLVIAWWLAQVGVGLWLGRLVLRRPEGAPWLPLAVGLVPVALLVTLPSAGIFIRAVAASIGIGAIALVAYRQRSRPDVEIATALPSA